MLFSQTLRRRERGPPSLCLPCWAPRSLWKYGCPGRCALHVCARQRNCGIPRAPSTIYSLWPPARAARARGVTLYIYTLQNEVRDSPVFQRFATKKTTQGIFSRTNITTQHTQAHTNTGSETYTSFLAFNWPYTSFLDFNRAQIYTLKSPLRTMHSQAPKLPTHHYPRGPVARAGGSFTRLHA